MPDTNCRARLFLLCSLLFLAGCTKTSNIPVWLLNPQEVYPERNYLAAVGEGDTRRAAENSAAAGLARIFESRISSSETLSETTTERRGSRELFEQFSDLRSSVQVEADQTLLNVQFGEAFKDINRRYHAVAFLPRAETAAIYRRQIQERSQTILLLSQRSDQSDDPVEKYALRRAAVREALHNDLLLDQLDIIDPQARDSLSLGYDPQALYSRTAELARNITFAVTLQGDAAPQAKEALETALTGMGFSKSESPTLSFTGTAEFRDTDLKRGSLVFVRYKISVEMRNRKDRLELVFEKSAREGHITFVEAQARAARAIQQEVPALVRRELSAYFDRQASAR